MKILIIALVSTLLISNITYLVLINKKKKTIRALILENKGVTYSNFDNDIAFLAFYIKWRTDQRLSEFALTTGAVGLNTDMFFKLLNEIIYAVKGELSPEYKRSLTKYLSNKGLAIFIGETIKSELLKYMQKNNPS